MGAAGAAGHRTRSVEEHAAAVAAALGGREVVEREVEAGLTLAASVSVGPMPRFDNSAMDGFALPTLEGPWEVGPMVAAGCDVAALYPRGLGAVAAPIMTGAELPAGTVAVVPVEQTVPGDFAAARVEVAAGVRVERGQFLRRQGSDMPEGARIGRAGQVITARLVGALAGVERVPVYRPARVLLCTGGDEVGGRGPGQIPDANGPMMAAMCGDYGMEVAGRVRTGDEPEELGRALRAAVEELEPDAIITSGGISHGAREVVRLLLHDGWFGHVAMQPGGPQGLGRFAGRPVVCLPGNPVSTAVSFRIFVAPVLGTVPESYEAEVDGELSHLPERECFVRVRGRDRVSQVGGAGSHLLAQSVEATGLARVPCGGVAPGQRVRVYPF